MFVGIKRISFRPGFYINFGIAFSTLAKGTSPTMDECVVDTDNPGLERGEKIRMLELLDDTKVLVASDALKQEFLRLFQRQLDGLERISTVQALRERMQQEPPLDAFVRTALLDKIK
jgi:hypothetical protein